MTGQIPNLELQFLIVMVLHIQLLMEPDGIGLTFIQERGHNHTE